MYVAFWFINGCMVAERGVTPRGGARALRAMSR
jgi:hypothetical protein